MCVVGSPLCESDAGGTVREVASPCIFRCKTSHVDEKQSSLSIVLLRLTDDSTYSTRSLCHRGAFSTLIDSKVDRWHSLINS